MNILKWLKNKAGKMPISFAQAAGLAAVVGAAGFGAMTYLSSPSADNNAFIPPSVYEQQGDVVYISQSGGGQYTSNGEVASAFHATQSDSIRLANQRFERESQARALEEADAQPTYAGDEGSLQMPKAYQMGQSDMGLGMGGTGDKQLNGSMEMFSQLQNQLSGVSEAMNKAQAQAAAQQGGAPAAASAGASGQSAAQLANAPRNWGQSGLTRAGSGSGVNNSFTIQDSGKNQGGKDTAAAMAQAGDVLADARAALNQMQEGTRMRSSRANFGRSDGLGEERDASGSGARRRFGNAKGELDWIRKQSAAIAKNKTNSANEGGRPFLASAKISGGIVVDGGNVTTGQGSSSGDLSTADQQLKGLRAGLGKIQANMDERKLVRDELKHWIWTALTIGISAMILISMLKRTFWGWFAAIAVAAATLTYIWINSIKKITNYNDVCGADKFTTWGWITAGFITAGVGAALVWGPKVVEWVKNNVIGQGDKITGPDTLGGSGGPDVLPAQAAKDVPTSSVPPAP